MWNQSGLKQDVAGAGCSQQTHVESCGISVE
uniref:Uncharacterized protein n=1 Tax=Arundo donax TaxID=35708 RepID=A0A0A8YY02_ARUDO